MPTFAYSGRTRAGQTVSGERIADTMDAAMSALRREQINVTRITPAAAKADKADAKAGAKAKTGKIGKKVAAKNLAVFTRQFSVMIDAGLPLPTRIVIALSDNLVRFFPFILVGGGAAAYGFKSYYATANGRRTIDLVSLKMPVLGNIMRKIAVARFCRTLSTLISSGVPILDGLEITAKTSGNAIVEDAIMVTRKSIERGETISVPLKETKVFPPMVTQMIGVGEATGALDTMLAKMAEFYEEEVDTAVAGLLTLLEPIMIAILGIVVGGIVIAMYLPIFDLISKLA